MRKTQRLEYEDGLRDFQIATIFLLVGLANWFIFTPTGLDLLARMAVRLEDLLLPALGGLLGLVLLLLFASEKVMERIRRATFWKDSGFVKPLRSGVVKNSIMVLSTIALLGIIIGSVWLMSRGILSQAFALRSIPASAGLATAIVFGSIGINLRIRRYILVSAAGAVLSTGLLLIEMTFASAYLWAGIGWALIFSISGIWALGWALRDLRGGA
jgi:hypothetical protein